jgi:drug/metabolite transporter (DMT)-like permease
MVGALVKTVSATLDNEMVVFLRNFFVMLWVLPWIRSGNHPSSIKTSCFRFHLVRALAGLFAMYCFFFALSRIPISAAFLLLSSSPLFIPIIAWIWLREPVAAAVRIAIVVGFLGVLFILKPGFGVFQPAALVGLGAGILSATAMVTIRRMSPTEPAIRILFYFTLVSTLASSVPLTWAWQTPEPSVLLLMALLGLLATAGQYLITRGYSFAPAAQLGPFTYSNVIFATVIGWVVWGETLDALAWVGAALICIAGIIASRRSQVPSALPVAAGSSVTMPGEDPVAPRR